jgi:uncharacterized protein (DUF433 family)
MSGLSLEDMVGQPRAGRQLEVSKGFQQPFERQWRQNLPLEKLAYIRGSEATEYSQGYDDFYSLSGISTFAYLRRKLKASSDKIQDVVAMDVQVMHGNPVFRGTRIPVYQIVEELADGTTLPELIEGYPSLSLEQIQSGLDFAASLLRLY